MPTAIRTCGSAIVAGLILVVAACAPDTPDTHRSAQPTASVSSPAADAPGETLAQPTVFATGLRAPWSVVPLADGGALVSQRDDGAILELDVDGHARVVGRITDVVHRSEAGLNGIAVWRGDGSTWLYAYYATDSDNRVVRMPLLGAAGSRRLGAPHVVIDGIRAAGFHNGGRLAFGPDGMLYVTTGDAGDSADAQDRSSLNGKILRVTPTGEPAPGNPFDSPVYSYGHRNVQGIAWTPDGTMWATEFGQNTWDELNVIVPGGDYGWPIVEGRAGDSRFRDPLVQWRTDQASPSGLAAHGWMLYAAALRGERLWQVRTAGATVVGSPAVALDGRGRLRDVVTGPSGDLWVLTNNTDGRGTPRSGDDHLLRIAVDPQG